MCILNKLPLVGVTNIIGSHYHPRRESVTLAGTHASPRLHWRRGHAAYQVIGKKEDLVPVGLLTRDEKGEIDWPRVNEPTRARFWKSHKRVWVDPILVGAPPELESKQQTKTTKP